MWSYLLSRKSKQYLNSNFNKETDKESYIVSFDVNSLYPHAMTKKLPYSEPIFDEDIEKCTMEYILSLNPFGEYCYVFNADLHYPSKLHDRDSEFPLLCDHDYPPRGKTKTLMSTATNKYNYTISLLMLQYVLKKGMKLKKIHHVIFAKQTDFIKPYILSNNDDRTKCSMNNDKFGSDIIKNKAILFLENKLKM